MPSPAEQALAQRIPQHTYSAGAMQLFLKLVLDAACSFRSASAVLELLTGWLPGLSRRPAANTGQSWLLRIGLYELTRPKTPAEDWVWIMDHTVQIGTTKCLLVVGCRLSQWRGLKRPLEHRDLQVFALEPVERSDGPTVARQLTDLQQRTGITPRALLTDEGTDLTKGIELFCQAHPDTAVTRDIAHQAAKHLKRELGRDPRWQAFAGDAGRAKQRLAQTPLAYLLPPTLRHKARFMNVAPLVDWGRNTLRYLDDPRPVTAAPVDVDVLRDKLGWLTAYREALADWQPALDAIDVTLTAVRTDGYHAQAADHLRTLLAPLTAATDAAEPTATAPPETIGGRIATALIDFVAAQSAAAKPGERLPGSSECLESLIGTGKRLERQQSQSGFTKLILGLAAAVVEPPQDYLRRALDQIPTGDVEAWCRNHLGLSLQSQRRTAFASGTKSG